MKKKMPTVDGWSHLSANYAPGRTFEQVSHLVIKDMKRQPTKDESERMLRSYLHGSMRDAELDLGIWANAASTELLEQVAREFREFVDRWREK